MEDTASLLACPYTDTVESWLVCMQNGRNLILVSDIEEIAHPHAIKHAANRKERSGRNI